jgi:hypothetical protein
MARQIPRSDELNVAMIYNVSMSHEQKTLSNFDENFVYAQSQ